MSEPGSEGSDRPPEGLDELVLENEGWTRRVPLGDRPLVLGRSSECDVQLPDPKLSRRHCRIAPGEAGWLVEDLGSSIGTFLDGRQLRGRASIAPGQRLRIGSMEARLERRPALGLETGRDSRNAEILLRTLEDLYGLEDLGELLRAIVDRAVELCGADRGALLLAGAQGALEAGVARDAAGRDLPAEQELTRSLPGLALRSGHAVVRTDTEAPGQRDGTPESVVREALRSVVCAPLPGGDRPVGVLYVDSHRAAEEFGPAELALFEALAVHGALAIERAQWREEREDRQRELRQRLEAENAALRAQIGADVPIGQSPAMLSALDLLRRVAPTDASVCLTGETGTGKEVLARWLHRLSPRAEKPFVVVDCGAIPEGLIESELFGHEKGAFTGAAAASEGRFREAEGGTVFLDEVGELPLLLQTRLLRVLQERTIQPVGARGRVPLDVRIVCATHRDLERRVEEGQFRQDLYYRLGVVTVRVPPLRERSGDVLLLAQHFLSRFAVGYHTAVNGFTREAQEALVSHSWPGNVRELENRVQRAVLLARPPCVTCGDLSLSAEGAPPSGPAEEELPFPELPAARAEATERFERAYLEEALRRSRGQAAEAIRLSGISKQMFYRLLQKHGIDRRRFVEEEG
jgi:transcriptional regulator with GAF, ATPase, and Fis domain